MARYVYEGQHPLQGPDGQLARPLDVREYDEPPAWGAWRLLDDGDPLAPPEPLQAVPPLPPPPPATGPAAAPTGTEG